MLPPFNAVQAFNDLDHVLRIEELYLLQRVAQKITSILDLETLLDQIVEDGRESSGLPEILSHRLELDLVCYGGRTPRRGFSFLRLCRRFRRRVGILRFK